MAKKILSENPSPDYTYEEVCGKCGTLFSFQQIDTYINTGIRYVECPKCNHPIYTRLTKLHRPTDFFDSRYND